MPAFSRLSLSLVALGAPACLVEAAHRAALEEIEHARLAFSLASAYAGEPVGPGPLPELQRAPAVTATSLAELAAESLIDGCLLEGVAAEVARRALFRARDRQVRGPPWRSSPATRRRTPTLAWDVVHWCCERGGDAVRRRLTAALAAAPVSPTERRIPERSAEALADHGWLGPATRDDAMRATSPRSPPASPQPRLLAGRRDVRDREVDGSHAAAHFELMWTMDSVPQAPALLRPRGEVVADGDRPAGACVARVLMMLVQPPV